MNMKNARIWTVLIGFGLANLGFNMPIWPHFKYDMQMTGHCPYIGPELPTVDWTFDTGDTFSLRSISPVIGADGTIYFGSNDSFFFAVTPNGQEKWRYKTRGIPGLPAIDTRGRIYFGVNNFELLAIDDSTTYGKLAWSWGPADTMGYSMSPINIHSDGTVYITFDSMRAFDSTGVVKWTVHRGEYGAYPPSISRDGQYLYYEYVPNMFNVAIRKTDLNANVLWTRIIAGAPTGLAWGSPAIGSDSTVYFAAGDGTIHAIRPNNMDKWPPISGLGTANVYMSVTLGLNDTLWFINRQRTPEYWKFEPDSGTEVFDGFVNEVPSHSNYFNCLTTDGLGQAYIMLWDSTGGSHMVTLYAFRADGSVKWTYEFPGRTFRSMPVLSPDSTLYVCAGTKLYAFKHMTGILENARASNRTDWINIFPNPSIGKANIRLQIPPQEKLISVKIYNSLGQLIRTLHDSSANNGFLNYAWDGRDQQNRNAEQGIYFCQVRVASGANQTMKLVLQK